MVAGRSSGNGDGWLKISREAESGTRNLYDSIFNKEKKKLVVENDRNVIDLDTRSPAVSNDEMKNTKKKNKKVENKNETNQIEAKYNPTVKV